MKKFKKGDIVILIANHGMDELIGSRAEVIDYTDSVPSLNVRWLDKIDVRDGWYSKYRFKLYQNDEKKYIVTITSKLMTLDEAREKANEYSKLNPTNIVYISEVKTQVIMMPTEKEFKS